MSDRSAKTINIILNDLELTKSELARIANLSRQSIIKYAHGSNISASAAKSIIEGLHNEGYWAPPISDLIN